MRSRVTPELREDVFARDAAMTSWYGQGPLCIAPYLDGRVDGCAGPTTLDHIKDQPRMGKRAPSDRAHLVSVCWHHHLDSGWATSHRPILRAYLASVEGR